VSVPPSVYPFDPYTYGQSGGEFDFWLTKTLPAFDPTAKPTTPPPAVKPPASGNGSGNPSGIPADVAAAHPTLASYLNSSGMHFQPFPAGQTQNPWKGQNGGQNGSQQQNQNFGSNALLALLAHLHQANQGAVPQSNPQQFPTQLGGGLQGRGYADGGAVTPPSGLNNNLQYLMSGLGSLAQPVNDPSQAPAPPTGPQNLSYDPRGNSQGGPGNQDDPGGTFSRENVSAHPNLKNSMAMAGLVGSLGNPLGLGLSLAGQALTGNSPLTADLGPRLAQEDLQTVSDAWTNTRGPLTAKMAAASKALQGARDKYGLPNGMTKSDITDVTPGDMQFGGAESFGNGGGGGNDSGAAADHGGGGIGSGRGPGGGGQGDNAGFLHGGIIHLIRRR